MPEARLDLKHVGILMRSHAKNSVRAGSGITFALIVVVLGLVVAGILIDPLDNHRKELEREFGGSFPREKFVAMIVEGMKSYSRIWLGAEPGDPQVSYLLNERPALLSVMFLILLALEPFVMAFGGFNQLSGDIANRGLRYLLLRTNRISIITARFLGTLVFSAFTSLFTVTMVVVYLAIRFDIYPLGELITWGLYGWAAINLFSLPYLALCTWVSTLMASPFGALAICQVLVGLPIVFVKWAKILVRRADLDWMDLITPWGWRTDLLHPEPMKVLASAGVMLGFTALFLFLAVRHFLRRDL